MWHMIGMALALAAAPDVDACRAKAERISVLMNQSETFGQIGYDLPKGRKVDQPSHLTPERVHGGVGQ
jgi:hypothetical protein